MVLEGIPSLPVQFSSSSNCIIRFFESKVRSNGTFTTVPLVCFEHSVILGSLMTEESVEAFSGSLRIYVPKEVREVCFLGVLPVFAWDKGDGDFTKAASRNGLAKRVEGSTRVLPSYLLLS